MTRRCRHTATARLLLLLVLRIRRRLASTASPSTSTRRAGKRGRLHHAASNHLGAAAAAATTAIAGRGRRALRASRSRPRYGSPQRLGRTFRASSTASTTPHTAVDLAIRVGVVLIILVADSTAAFTIRKRELQI